MWSIDATCYLLVKKNVNKMMKAYMCTHQVIDKKMFRNCIIMVEQIQSKIRAEFKTV